VKSTRDQLTGVGDFPYAHGSYLCGFEGNDCSSFTRQRRELHLVSYAPLVYMDYRSHVTGFRYVLPSP
jgi:hypothetical protein